MGYELFRELVSPGLSPGYKNIVIIPDDILHLLPFETLIIHPEERDWLIKEYSIAYIPSFSSLRELAQRKHNGRKPTKDILVFGDPFYGPTEEDSIGSNPQDAFQDFYTNAALKFSRLKYSSFEINKIISLFKPAKRESFRRESASEDQLKAQDLADYKILHFATHGLIDDNKPARSSIILSLDEDPTEDGLLQMREVFNLKMNSDLVTLSACQTGLGRFIRGEGIEGLSRAFFYAGASSVLMSLWAVNDEATYQLMERFYYHLRSSETLSDALQDAKVELIESGVLSHPYYWAGFILTGRTDKAVFPRKSNLWLFWASPLCAGLMIIIAVKRRRKKNHHHVDQSAY